MKRPEIIWRISQAALGWAIPGKGGASNLPDISHHNKGQVKYKKNLLRTTESLGLALPTLFLLSFSVRTVLNRESVGEFQINSLPL